MKNIKNFAGFSLAEMMVVLLIVAIVMAASVPMISKKMVKGAESDPWAWIGNDGTIGYNLSGRDTSILIGALSDTHGGGKARLYIESNDAANNPQIKLYSGDYKCNPTTGTGTCGPDPKGNPESYTLDDISPMSIGYTNTGAFYASTNATNIGGKSLAIGYNTTAQNRNTVALGANSESSADSAISVGADSKSSAENAISVGADSKAEGNNTIAIGNNATAQPKNTMTTTESVDDAVAIGTSAKVKGNQAIAIGKSASANRYDTSYATSGGGGGSDDKGGSDNSHGPVAIGGNSYAASLAVALGASAKSYGGSVAIGKETSAHGASSVAIGNGATANHNNSIAIGKSVSTAKDNQIVLGTKDHTVHIPGNLTVEGNFTIDNLSVKNLNVTNELKARLDFDNNNLYTLEMGGKQNGYYSVIATFQNPSDRRLKNVGEVFKGGLAEINKLETFHFTYKKDEAKTPHVGVIAQDLQKIFPDAVIKGEDGFLRIRMEDMFYALVNAVKELDVKITKVTEQVKSNMDLITKLQDKVQIQEKQIDELTKQNAEFAKQQEEFEKRLAKLEK